jgi:hypothetical protein
VDDLQRRHAGAYANDIQAARAAIDDVERKAKQTRIWWTCFLAVIALIWFIGATLPHSSSDSEAWGMAKEFVSRNLKAPATAEFPNITDNAVKIVKMDESRYTVSAYVDSENGYGAKLRGDWVCILRHEGNGQWIVEDVQIQNR